MSKIFITGCSSGFGNETAKLFLERGWEVVAGMRKTDDTVLPKSERLKIVQLDVTDSKSVKRVMTEVGNIDVLVNNAGFAAPAPVELAETEMVRALFETNAIGALTMCQAVLPSFRERHTGIIINVSSSTTLRPLPLVGLYRASKAAMNAYTESLAIEVKPFGIRAHVVLPGRAPETSFGKNAMPHLRGTDHPDYAPMIEKVVAGLRDTSGPMTYSADVAETIWQVVNEADSPVMVAAGADAKEWLAAAGKN